MKQTTALTAKERVAAAYAKQAEVDRKVAEYSAIARAELARLTALVASYEAKADATNHTATLANWADVNEVADLARSLKDTMPGFTSR